MIQIPYGGKKNKNSHRLGQVGQVPDESDLCLTPRMDESAMPEGPLELGSECSSDMTKVMRGYCRIKPV